MELRHRILLASLLLLLLIIALTFFLVSPGFHTPGLCDNIYQDLYCFLIIVFFLFLGHSTLDFVVSSQHDDYELAVRIIHCPDWSHSLPKNVNKNFDVLKLVQDWHLEYQDGPLVVVDK